MSSKKHFIKDISRRILGFLLVFLLSFSSPILNLRFLYDEVFAADEKDVLYIQLNNNRNSKGDIENIYLEIRMDTTDGSEFETIRLSSGDISEEIAYNDGTDNGSSLYKLPITKEEYDAAKNDPKKIDYANIETITIIMNDKDRTLLSLDVDSEKAPKIDYIGSEGEEGDSSYRHKNNEDLVIVGENLKDLESDDIKITKTGAPANKLIFEDLSTKDKEITLEGVKSEEDGLGYQTVTLIKADSGSLDGGKDYLLNFRNTYEDKFFIYDDFENMGDIQMAPTYGVSGEDATTVYFKLESGNFKEKSNYDIFFRPKEDQKYYMRNKVDNDSINIISSTVMEFKVPKDAISDDYTVELINYISNKNLNQNSSSDEIAREITKIKEIGLFAVSAGLPVPKIKDIDPDKGSQEGIDITIESENLEELGYIKELGFEIEEDDIESIKLMDKKESLNLNIFDDTDNDSTEYRKVLIKYKDLPGGIEVEKKIAIRIGNNPVENYLNVDENGNFNLDDFKKNGLDTLKIETPPVGDAGIGVQPLDIIIETKIDGKYISPYIAKGEFEYEGSSVLCEIDSISPSQINLKPNDTSRLKEDIAFDIKGRRFKVYGYKKDGEQHINYPEIDLGGIKIKKVLRNGEYVVVQNPGTSNEFEINAEIDIYNTKGEIVDGGINNETGEKIVVKLKAEPNVGQSYIFVPDGVVDTSGEDLRIANPKLNSTLNGVAVDLKGVLKFIASESNPVIEVEPNVTDLDSGDEIIITGSNIDKDTQIYISGILVEQKSFESLKDGAKIIVNAPTFPDVHEGTTVLQAVNLETGSFSAGSHSVNFIFVKSITEQPEVTSFAPKKGTKDTLVVVDGQNFVDRQLTVNDANDINAFRLIGTRIYMKTENQATIGQEVNEYQKVEDGVPQLQSFSSSDSADNKIIKVQDGFAVLSDYYKAIILKQENVDYNNFAKLDYDEDDNIILYDGGNVDEDDSYKFRIYYSNSQQRLKAVPVNKNESGEEYNININNNGISILGYNQDSSDVNFSLNTFFKFNNGFITGQRAYVVDKNRIMLTIPEKVRGLYNIVAVNPDTKSGVSKELFEYFERAVVPSINKVTPSSGSYVGGYSVVIDGTNFEDNSIIYIDGIKLDEEAYRKEGNAFIIDEFPAYDGDLKDEGIDRKDVPISIENSGGGSITKSKGFTYVIPGAAPPEIVDISLQGKDEGTAATSKGGEILNIDFKYVLFEEPSATQPKYKTWIEGKDEEGNTIYFDDLNGNNEFDKFIDIKDIPEENGIGGAYFKDLDEKIDTYERYIDNDISNKNSLIFPQVYIGGKKAKIVEYKNTSGTGGYLKVVTPINQEGDQDVYIVNNDFGISNTVSLEYEGLNPEITSMNPASGPISGNRKTYVYGQGFDVTKYKLSKADGSGFEQIDQKMPIVRFGEYEASKDINNNTAEVSIEDQKESLTVNYAFDGSLATLDIEIDASKTNQSVNVDDSNFIFKKQYKDYENDKVYIDLTQIQNESGTNYLGYEYIEINVDKDVLYVKRGFAPKAELVSGNEAIVYTPSYSEVKSGVRVRYINPDETFADYTYDYLNPESLPFIDDILKDNEWRPGEEIDKDGNSYRVLRVNYKGGYTIQINGGDFRQGATVKIGNLLDITNEQINEDGMPTSLSFVMPELSEDVVGTRYNFSVLNPDGASALSDDDNVVPPIYIEFTKGEPIPDIESIEPDAGLSTGGTLVTIRGNTKETVGSFRQGLQVMFGDVEGDVQSVSYNEIKVLTPPHIPGVVDVTVENPDGERATKEEGFTYLSDPLITAILSPNDEREVDRISSVSIEGGQKIKVKGNGFMEGARVVFYPVVEEKETDNDQQEGQDIFRKGEEFVLVSFGEGQEVEFIDSETLIVTTPEGKLDAYGIMVINPDLGSSNIYEDLRYGLPQIDAPTGVVAELMYDRYIKVFWDKVDEAAEYEVYVVIDDNEFELIGSTKQQSLIYEDLESRTRYKFIVKTLGEYGESKASNESNSVKTGSNVGYEDSDEGLIDNTQIVRSGPKVNVVLGTSDYDDKELRIDLTRGELAGANEITISMPAEIISDNDAKDVYIMANSYSARFNPMSFNNDLMEDNDNNDETGIRLKLRTDSMEYVKPVGKISKSVISDPIVIEGSYFDDKYEQKLDYMNGYINLSMDYDMQRVQMRNYKVMTLNYFDEYSDSWNPVIGNADTGYNVNGNINRAGKYIVIGSKY